jgi:O-antigen/teichoic acid export membrane protein
MIPELAPPTPPTRAQAVQSAFWAASGALGRYALAGITMLILTRLLDPGDFGLVAITYAAQALIITVIPIGFHDALIQRPHLAGDDLNSAFWSVLILSGGILLLVILFAPAIAGWFDQPILARLLAGMAIVSMLRALDTVPRALLNRRLDFRTLTVARLAGTSAGSVCAITLAALGGGAWSLIAQSAALNLTAAFMLWRATGWRPGGIRRVSRSALRILWQFAPSVSIFTVLTYIIENADDQLVGYHLGPDALGFYALAYSFMAWPVRDVLGSVSGVLYPIFSRVQDDRSRLHTAYLESLQLATAFAFPTLALIAITAPVLIPWLLGPRWSPIVLTAQIFALGGLRASTMMFNGLIFRALGKPHLHALFQLCGLGPALVAFVVGLDFGIGGVAFFFVLAGVMLHPVSWWMVLRTARLAPAQRLRALLPTATATALMSVAAVLTLHAARHNWGFTPFPALALTGVVSAMIYAGVLIVWSPAGLRRTLGVVWQVARSLVLMTIRRQSGGPRH